MGCGGHSTKGDGKMVSITAKGSAGLSVDIGPIDTQLLQKQKEALVEMIWDDEKNILWGLVYMLDDILDEEMYSG